ncbi:PrgI family protein [Desertibacillus haloalkaliphilus]|uniref:PrgI family protein n=1 Tax=Desertibacillus haloalkaliphilus TaxID=1328930 RepID=UPI001C264B2D|nr:PrgI family protein [Desertibacillus haloalkaliphilus]MBU8908091.1 PrgI family protein [Desertibacillus haloalkaliphilus]
MRTATVPEDMSSEQKTILGVISVRQLIYLIIGGGALYGYIPVVFNMMDSFVTGIIACLFSVIPTAAIVGLLGFRYMHDYHMFYDKYLIVRIGYKHQIGVWRKGKDQSSNIRMEDYT